MRLSFLCIALLAGAAQAQELSVPSGIELHLLDRIVETQADGSVWLTLRYVSRDIGEGKRGYDDVSSDLDHLCDTEGLAAAADVGEVAEISITLMDREVEWGTHDPDATMFIGSYLPEDGSCVWQ